MLTVFSVLGAFLIAYILKKLKWTSTFGYWRLVLFSWLTLFTHMILDAFTTYGTQLYLPFSDFRVSLDSINVVDPFYTIPLLVGLIISSYYRNEGKFTSANQIGLAISTTYLLFTFAHKQYVTESVKKELAEQGINYNSVKTIPVGVGNVNWYGISKSTDSLYLGKYVALDKSPIIFHAFPINSHLLNKINVELAEKLIWFSQDYHIVVEKEGKIRLYNLQCDMQGVRTIGNYKAPTAFYFEITTNLDGTYQLSTGMHQQSD